MCWSSKGKTIEECKKVAQKDILVRKIMVKETNSYGLYDSYFQHATYEVGETYNESNINNNHQIECRWMAIARGLHSYSPKCILRQPKYTSLLYVESIDGKHTLEIYSMRVGIVLVDCIIPKGTVYYVNEDGEYVSESIKVIGDTDLEKEGIKLKWPKKQ